jgi:hemoglobin
MATIYEQSGGFAEVRKVVSAFYDKVLDSPRLQTYFEDTDMRRLIDHQTKFITAVMGGPAKFNDEAMRRAHARFNITREEYREAVDLLVETLEDFGMDDDAIETVCNEVDAREHLIVLQ